jgi:hypothetical protein
MPRVVVGIDYTEGSPRRSSSATTSLGGATIVVSVARYAAGKTIGI